jgi:D-sedoheptulose 7-phosphate isomerase
VSNIDRHIEGHLRTIEALRAQTPAIETVGGLVLETLERGGCIFWCGNGGSAADCQHLAAELVGRFERNRRGLASVALTTDTSVLTAIANDYGFEQVFSRQLDALCRPGDLAIGISTSGTSPSVLEAMRTARNKGAATAGLSGRNGGLLKDVTDACVIVPSSNTARIQEAHILVGHMLCDMAERHLGQPGSGIEDSG